MQFFKGVAVKYQLFLLSCEEEHTTKSKANRKNHDYSSVLPMSTQAKQKLAQLLAETAVN